MDGAVFTYPGQVPFSATRDSSGCTIAPSSATLGLYIRFPGATSFDIFQYNITDEKTISKSLPLTPGVYQWKAALTCTGTANPDGSVTSMSSKVRTVTVAASVPPDTTTPTVTLSGKASQKIGETVRVKLHRSEACTVKATGKLIVPGIAKTYRLAAASATAAADADADADAEADAQAAR
jgi:hypothetical protein